MRAAVLGSPIAHSLSPVLHRAAYAELGLPWQYDAIDVAAGDLAEFLATCDDNWVGLSLTMPLKEVVLGMLDQVSDLAAKTRSANTVLRRDGLLVGYNTDVAGIQWALEGAATDTRGSAATDTRGSAATDTRGSAAIFGAGATARSAVAALGALGFSDVVVVARRPEAVVSMADAAGISGIALATEPWSRGTEVLGSDVVISTVPVGVADELARSVPHQPGVLLDVVYAPWPSVLAKSWRDQGGIVIGGFEMLLGQAIRQVELMTGTTAPVAAMRAAGEAELAARNA